MGVTAVLERRDKRCSVVVPPFAKGGVQNQIMYYVYLLQSKKDEGFYIGFSANIEKRMIDHQEGLVDSTKHRRPLALIYYECYSQESYAREREKKLKSFGSAYIGLLKRLKLK